MTKNKLITVQTNNIHTTKTELHAKKMAILFSREIAQDNLNGLLER
jgi:hypothetical protein